MKKKKLHEPKASRYWFLWKLFHQMIAMLTFYYRNMLFLLPILISPSSISIRLSENHKLTKPMGPYGRTTSWARKNARKSRVLHNLDSITKWIVSYWKHTSAIYITLAENVEFASNCYISFSSHCVTRQNLQKPSTERWQIRFHTDFRRKRCGLVRLVAVNIAWSPTIASLGCSSSPSVLFTVSPDHNAVTRGTRPGDSGDPLIRLKDGVQLGVAVCSRWQCGGAILVRS